MSPAEARRLVAEADKRARRAVRRKSSLHPAQQRFMDDPDKRKAAVCSRRAGKTRVIGHMALETAARWPDLWVPYVTLTKDQARRNFWPVLRTINREQELGIAFDDHRMVATLTNGAHVFCVGMSDHDAMDRLRGAAGGFPLVLIDEAQAFKPYLKELVDDVLDAATLDCDGTIVMTGTPGAACAGLFFEVTEEGKYGWSNHRWTVLDNPYLPNAPAWLEKKKRRNKWADDHPTYRREWLGQWVRDGSGLMYPFDWGRNVVDAPPDLTDGDWQYVLGCDLGYVDSTAFVVLACSPERAETYVLEVEKRTGLIPSAFAAIVEQYRARFPFERVVADTGGFGKGYVEEANQRWGLGIEPAEKPRLKKAGDVELIRGELLTGQLKFVGLKCKELLDEIRVLQWNEDRDDSDERFEDHAADALLYGWRATRAWMWEPELEAPREGTPEWRLAQEAAMEAAAAAELQQRGEDRPDADPSWVLG